MATKFVDDDETVEVPKAATAAATKAEEPKPAAKTTAKHVVDDGDEETTPTTKSASASVAEDEDTDFGDEKLMSKSDGLDRLRPEKGRVVRFSFLPFLKPKRANTHYIEKKGTYRCMSQPDQEPASCCKKLGDSDTRIVALALEYTNANGKTGSLKDKNNNMLPIEYAIKFVQMSRTNYRAVSKLPDEDATVYDIDIVMSHKDNGIGYEFSRISPKAVYKKNAELMAEVEAAVKPFLDGKKLSGKLGKKVSPIEFRAVLASLTAGADDANMDDVENL